MNMSADDFFPTRTQTRPTIYAYSDPSYPGCLKVGFTGRDVVKRIDEQYPIILPGKKKPYRIELQEPAMYADGGSFTDKQVHDVLRKRGVECVGGEWFRCSVDLVREAVVNVRNKLGVNVRRSADFAMRPEQEEAVERTMAYFNTFNKEQGLSPQFLWNAKMRFGKTFASYQLAKRMGMKRVLVLTFKPATMNAWEEDLNTHVDFEGWKFICRPKDVCDPNIDEQYRQADKSKPIVCFGSFQDFMGVNKETGGIKTKNTWVHEIAWDLIIFDEYHFGAWRDNAKSLFEMRDDEESDESSADMPGEGQQYGGSSWLPLTAQHYLYLSGTPFRALNDGEFIEEQIYGWTYSDEQRAKANWKGPQTNPYAALPRLVMLAYCMPESMREIRNIDR